MPTTGPDDATHSGQHAPVTVIIPVRDRRELLAAALASVAAQTISPAEVLVIDDGSAEPVDEVIAGFPGVRLIRQPALGAYIARNRGIAESTQPYIAFLDSDDVWMPDKLEAQLPRFRNEEIGVVFGNAAIRELTPVGTTRLRGTAFGICPPGRCAAAVLTIGNFVPFSTLVVRRSVFERMGGFDPRSRLSADWIWLLRARRSIAFAYVPAVISEYRRHSGNWSRSYPQALNSRIDQLQELLAVSEPDERSLFQQALLVLRWRVVVARLRGRWKGTPPPPARSAAERLGIAPAIAITLRLLAREVTVRLRRLF